MKQEPITPIDGSILLQGGPTRTRQLKTALQITGLHGQWLGRTWLNCDHLAELCLYALTTAEEYAETFVNKQ